MKKLNHRPKEAELFIEALPDDFEDPVIAQLDGKIVGVLKDTGNGWSLPLGPNKAPIGFAPTLRGCIEKCEKLGYTFYINE